MTRLRAIGSGALAGFIAGLLMTVTMLLLAWLFGVATPLVIFGDRISVFIPADTFLSLMGRVGGYNNMKQLGVGSVMGGQLLVGALGGMIYGLAMRRRDRNSFPASVAIFTLLPLVAVGIFLWPVLGTHYHGLPINRGAVVTLAGLLASFVVFERTLALVFRYLTQPRVKINGEEFSPPIGRRALITGGLALLAAGGGAALLRRLYQIATFSYDGTQYKGRVVRAITPNDLFYCVTKNVVDPKVDPNLWRLEITGLVKTPQTYQLDRLKALSAVEQETTLMCISNGLDAGLMSNAKWKGVPMSALLNAATTLPGATKVRLHGVDNYTDTFPLEKAMDPTTLVVYEMNGETLPDRHGFPARVIVPGYFGEKHVKWITRIEVADDSAVGFYEKQGWGPDFIVPTRSRFDEPDAESVIPSATAANGVAVRGVAFGGDRGISRVEVSFDDAATWQEAKLDYPGTKLTWALWSYDWRPMAAGNYALVVRATDGEGEVQELDEDRPFKSGTTGFHRIMVYVT
ncbi:MAG TPA: molybdopterin-dependent oxidoreductase [Chthoniobacterales bacterium]|nr:molybdopterin-dependent oxidoreductase [Chthoniobacterales bacterium]